jgi:hypothetical protein
MGEVQRPSKVMPAKEIETLCMFSSLTTTPYFKIDVTPLSAYGHIQLTRAISLSCSCVLVHFLKQFQPSPNLLQRHR